MNIPTYSHLPSYILKRHLFAFAGCLAVFLSVSVPDLQAQSLTWDSSGSTPLSPVGGPGTWSTTDANWSNGTTNSVWNNAGGNSANFLGNLGSAATVTLGGAITVNSIVFNSGGSASYQIDGGGNTLTVTSGEITANRATNINAQIAGSNGLTKKGFSTLRLLVGNSYTGNTVIEQGILEARAAGSLPTTTVVTLGVGANDATLELRGNQTIAGLNVGTSGTAIVRTNANSAAVQTLTINSDGAAVPGNSTFSGTLADHAADRQLALTKAGSMSLVLTGTNTYTGATNVNGGSLIVNGSLANTEVSVAAAGTLGGEGSIAGDTTISGTLSPGNSTGLLSFGGNLTLTSTANTLMQLNGSGRGASTDGYDAINLTNTGGIMSYGGTLTLSMTDLIANETYNLFDFTTSAEGGLSGVVFADGAYTGIFSGSSGIWSATSDQGQSFSFSESTGSLVVIPEPSSGLLLLVALFAMGGFMLRKTHRRSIA